MTSNRLRVTFGALAAGVVLLAAAACGGSSGTRMVTETETKRGGTIRVNLASDTDYTDPALAYYSVSWQFEYATALKLLNYPDAPAPAGSRLQPEAAAALPNVSADGKT